MCNDNNMFIDDETVSCGSNVQIPSFLWVNNTVSLLFCCRFVPGILGFQYGSVVKIPLAQAKCIFFLHSSIDIFPCENIPCPMSYSINDMLPSSAVVQFPFSPKIKQTCYIQIRHAHGSINQVHISCLLPMFPRFLQSQLFARMGSMKT